MRKVALVFCEEAFWGWFSPLSFFSEANLLKVIGLLKNDAFDNLYVVNDNIRERNIEEVEKYFDKLVAQQSGPIQARIFAPLSLRPYLEGFVDYVAHIPEEVHVDIFTRADQKSIIACDIMRSLSAIALAKTGRPEMPSVTINGLPVKCPAVAVRGGNGKVYRNLLEKHHYDAV